MEKKFAELGLREDVLRGISDMGYEEPSAIQAEVIPVLLSGKDAIGQAQTGTGKTLAFAAPILSRLTPKGKVSAIILTPTRELAIQVNEEINTIAKHVRVRLLPVYGGQPIDRQIRALRSGIDIVVGTPGRVIDLMDRGILHLEEVDFLVLDEADEMLNMGFIEDIERIMRDMNEDKQTMLFSATMPKEIKTLSKRYMKEDREHITVVNNTMTVSTVDQFYFEVKHSDRFESLCRIMDAEEMDSVIIFCKTKRGVDELVDSLSARGYNAAGMHGDMNQNQRISTLAKFKEKNLEFLVATDVAARGIDVDNISHVINYDLPQDTESYVHRIGRTGRARKEGIAYTLVTPREYLQLKDIERMTKSKIKRKDIPTIDDIFSSKYKNILSRITKELEDEKYKRFVPLVAELDETYNMIDVSAALMNLIYKDELSFEYTQNSLTKPKTQVRLFINVGSMDKLSPKKLLEFLTEHAGTNSDDIGTIDILPKFTFVNVKDGVEDRVVKYCSGKKLSGRRANIEVAANRKK